MKLTLFAGLYFTFGERFPFFPTMYATRSRAHLFLTKKCYLEVMASLKNCPKKEVWERNTVSSMHV